MQLCEYTIGRTVFEASALLNIVLNAGERVPFTATDTELLGLLVDVTIFF
jgi:hypothetical protein